MKTEELLKPRYKVIADYPDCPHAIGDILIGDNDLPRLVNMRLKIWIDYFRIEKFPHLFKKLEWWEERKAGELLSVTHVKVIKYRGYWREGQVVPVIKFEPGSIEESKPYGYLLKYNHWQPVFELLPATLEEFNSQSK